MQPSWRKPAGVIAMLFWIAAWSVLVVSLLEWIGGLPFVLAMLAYLIAGIAWIAPLRPLMIWMETGRWR